MFSSIWNFVKRHRKKFIFTGVLFGGAWAFGKYAKKMLIEMQEKEAAECMAHARRQHHFDSNQRTCNMTVLSMLPALREALQKALDSESLTAQLKHKPANKLEIWEQLKVISFCRTISAVYSVCILISMLRVQLNIIGGYMYLDSIHSTGQGGDAPLATPSIQQKYLASIQYVVDQGLQDLVHSVEREVSKIISSMSLKQAVTLADIQSLLTSVREGVEYRQSNGYHDAAASSLVHYMLPPDDNPQACALSGEDLFLNKLQQETRDMLESGDFHSVVSTMADTAFTRLLDRVAEYYRPAASPNGTITSVNDLSLPLAKLVPIMNGLLFTVCADAPNTFVQELLLKDQVKNFAANVYEAFSQPENGDAHTMA